jgi:hypothetical protein
MEVDRGYGEMEDLFGAFSGGEATAPCTILRGQPPCICINRPCSVQQHHCRAF